MTDVTETKTIDQFLAENPDVDVSKTWERCWGTLSGIGERIRTHFDMQNKHPSCEGRDYYTSPPNENGDIFEGSFNAWSNPSCEWMVNSWIGNRKASILDMNATAFLGPQTRVPHLVLVFGTIPRPFMYADFTPRVDLMVNEDYLNHYYAPISDRYIQFRSDPRLTWAVSHGSYMRALLSPVACSFSAEDSGAIDAMEDHMLFMTDTWFNWLKDAEPVPEAEQAAQQAYDHKVRELGYRLDPMNKLAANIFGADEVDKMVNWRMGADQMAEAKRY